MFSEELYKKWLTAAYRYYIRPDLDSKMTDYEWDNVCKLVVQNIDRCPEMKSLEYSGGSLFWMRFDDYPEWAKTEQE
jgi:hypothetical protein